MLRMNNVLFTAFRVFLLASLGCATAKPLPEPTDIPTLGQLALRGDPLPEDQALVVAARLVPFTKFANLNEACEVAMASDKDLPTARDRSLMIATRDLSIAFADSDPAKLKTFPARTVWWPSVDNETCFTLLCVVPPAAASAQNALERMPGRHAPPISVPAPAVVQTEAVGETAPVVAPAPKPALSVWDGAAKHRDGEAFAFDKQLCSVGRAEVNKPRQLDEAKDASSFLAASNILYALKSKLGIEAYDNDAEKLLANALHKEWRLPSKASIEAAVCVALPKGIAPPAPVAAN